MSTRAVTLIIHGTFAAEATWWQLGGGLFADQLESALSNRGLKRSVWAPVLNAGMAYEDFAWSGKNTHGERMKAARALAARLNELAERLTSADGEPPLIHLVGHSHGGNVILEALRIAEPRYRLGNVVLMGTPLLRFTPSFRIGRLFFAATLTSAGSALVFSVVASPLIVLLIAQWEGWRNAVLLAGLGLGLGVLGLLLLGNVFGIVRGLCDGVWWLIWKAAAVLRGRRGAQVYGPSSREWIPRLEGKKILSLSSPVDEAGLGLLIASAPRLFLAEKIRGDLLVYLDFIFFDFVVDIPEALCERAVLGMDWIDLLFRDFSIAHAKDDRAYPASVFQHEDVSVDLELPSGGKALSQTRGDPEAQRIDSAFDTILRDLRSVKAELNQDTRLSERTGSVRRFLADQIRLRHSLYYENERLIERVAAAIAG